MTYTEIFAETKIAFENAGIEAAALEARLIAEKAAGKTREEFIRDGQLSADGEFRKTAWDMMRRRLMGEPVAYILGEWEFFSLPFSVTRDTLIPRVDSEVLVDSAIELLKGVSSPHILDLCCGSGCLGIAVGVNVPDSNVIFADYSGTALTVCRDNFRRNGLAGRARVTFANALSKPWEEFMTDHFDMLLCNPPYIPSRDIKTLDSSVREFEPLLALDGGRDGLKFYRTVASLWKSALKDGGQLLFECGTGQAEDVRRILVSEGFSDIRTVDDTAGIPRVVIAQK